TSAITRSCRRSRRSARRTATPRSTSEAPLGARHMARTMAIELDGALARVAHGARIAPRVVHAPLLEALVLAGTSHVSVDTADDLELATLALSDAGELVAEIDGNTINQPLVAKIVGRELDGPLASWLRELRARAPAAELAAWAYAAVNVRIGHAIVDRFA